jgi:hypothetical protein
MSRSSYKAAASYGYETCPISGYDKMTVSTETYYMWENSASDFVTFNIQFT